MVQAGGFLWRAYYVEDLDFLYLAASTGAFLVSQQAISRLVLKPISHYFVPSAPPSPPIRDFDSAIDLEELNNSSFAKLPDSELELPTPPPYDSIINNNDGNKTPPRQNGHHHHNHNHHQQDLGHLVAAALPDPLNIVDYEVKRHTPLRHRKPATSPSKASNDANGDDDDDDRKDNSNRDKKESKLMTNGLHNNNTAPLTAPSTPPAMARRNQAKAIVDDRKKFQVAAWKLWYSTFVSTLGLIVLSQESWALDPSQYFVGWQDKMAPMSDMMKVYYVVSFGNYAAQAIAIFFEPRLKDFWQMFCHHIITCNLIFFSYWMGFYRVGSVIVLVHDVSDPWMELAKCFHYTNNELMANVFFATFAACFIYTRNWIFPRYIIYPITEDGFPLPNGPVLGAFIAGLCLLEALHIFWATLIVGMIKEAITSGGVQGDTREDD
ncbi:hypothetical protein SmJEL517_g05875 [Synchytrium microbalum]|uniref:TLC domain-containing protein n=1 Tax=Synchytrium microbalum TaxID=1806994 RepID=A0A507BIS7_9FUNG|nr:uncharacterized protein SmJEL517_g05875 [Synchytrium microbalum]TPX30590.1 hypothetical protein SmJEL517_g05875 [Synchytrium microbalum]